MRLLSALASTLFLLGANQSALAQVAVTGYGAITCRELVRDVGTVQATGLANWMSGYLSGQNVSRDHAGLQHDISSYDQDEFTTTIYGACAQVPNELVVRVVDMLLETKL